MFVQEIPLNHVGTQIESPSTKVEAGAILDFFFEIIIIIIIKTLLIKRLPREVSKRYKMGKKMGVGQSWGGTNGG